MANLVATATFPSAGGDLTLFTPFYDVWDFDDQAVTAWDTDTTAGTEAALESAITTAMGLGTTASPQYHRITWTGGTINSDMFLTSAAAIPDKYGPHILIDGGSYTQVNAEIEISTISNCKFVGFQFQRDSDYASDGFHQPCVRFNGNGGGRRFSFGRNRIGQHWAGGVRNTFPWFIRTAEHSWDWEVTVENNEIRRAFEVAEWSGGKLAVKHNFVTGLIDDFVFMAGRGHNAEAYVYAVGNVICDMWDLSSDVGFHCDFVQCADNNDTAGDSYRVEAQANLFIGNTYQQYPTMASIIQKQGGAVEFRTKYWDNIFLNTGTRGFYLPDRRTSLHRNMHAWPPLGGAVPTTGTGWQGGPFRQSYQTQGSYGTDGDIDISQTYWAAQNASNNNSWGTLPNPAQIVRHDVALGGSQSYDTRFPNMTGLTFNGSTLIIDNGWSSVTRDAASMRSWVASTYEPNTTANGTGWSANGFTSPANWF